MSSRASQNSRRSMSQRIGAVTVFASVGDQSTRCPQCGNVCGLDYSGRMLRTHWSDGKAKDRYCDLSKSRVTILDPSLDPSYKAQDRRVSSKSTEQRKNTTNRKPRRPSDHVKSRTTKIDNSKSTIAKETKKLSSGQGPRDIPIRKSERKLQREATAELERQKRESRPAPRKGMVLVWTEKPGSTEMEWVHLNPITVEARGVCECPMCGKTVNIDLRGCKLNGHRARIKGRERNCPAIHERFAFIDRFGNEIGKDLPPDQKHLALSNMSQGTDRVIRRKRSPMTEEQRQRRLANRRKRNLDKMTMYSDSPYFDDERYQVSDNSVNAVPGGIYGSNRRH